MKTRPPKTKSFIWMFIPIIKKKKKFFCEAKVIEGPKTPEGPLRVLFRFHSDRVLFRFLSNRVLWRVLNDRVLFQSSVIGSSSEPSVIDFSLGFFFQYATFFIKTCYYFLLKTDVLFCIIFSKRTSHLTISSQKNEVILA